MGKNLALIANASASSYSDPYEPKRAINGGTTDQSSRWLCGLLPGWLMLDLKDLYWVSQWSVKSIGGNAGWPANYCMTNFKLQISLNGVDSWIDVDAVTGNTALICTRVLPGPVKARFWRLYVPAKGGLAANKDAASIMELELIQADPTPSNLTALILKDANNTAVTLNPAFGQAIYNYTASVPFTTSSVTVTPVAQDLRATIKVNGTVVISGQTSVAIPLAPGNMTSINVEVIPYVGSTTTVYSISVTRADSLNLSSLVVKDQTGVVISTNPAFAKGTLSYTATVVYETQSVTLTPTKEGVNSTITVDGQTVASGTQSQTIPLTVGTLKTMNVVVTSGSTSQTYTVNATRPGSAKLTTLAIQNGTANVPLNPVFAQGITAYTASVDNSVASVNVIPTAEDTTAALKVNTTSVASGGSVAVPLNEGPNTVKINVTPALAVPQDYTVTLTRARSAYLSNLVLTCTDTTAALNPSFNTEIFNYDYKVVGGVNSVKFTPSFPAGCTVTVNGLGLLSGSRSITLTALPMVIPVKVVKGEVSVIYNVTVKN